MRYCRHRGATIEKRAISRWNLAGPVFAGRRSGGECIVSTVPTRLYSADYVVAAFDHRQVGVGTQTWVLEVLGVHRIGTDLWGQIARRCCPEESLIVRIAPGATADDVLHAIAWTPCGSFPRILAVSSAQTHGFQ